MENDPSPKARRKSTGWRGKTPSADPATKHGWHGDYKKPAAEASKQNLLRRLMAIAIVGVSVILAAVTAWYVWMIPVSTPLLIFSVVDYAEPIPPNDWAHEDFTAFSTAWSGGAGDGFQLYPLRLPKTSRNVVVTRESRLWNPADVNSAKREFREAVAALKPGGPDEDRGRAGTVIIYLSGHGIVDDAGRPCLLLSYDPALARALGRDTTLPYLENERYLAIEDVVKIIGEVVPPAASKLLVLDCHRLDVEFNLGVLYNAFADRLPTVVKNTAPPNLAVLTAAGPGQVAWSSPQTRSTVFGHFVKAGLLGRADGNHDGEVTVRELYGFVRDRTERWVAQYGSDVQRPMLLPDENRDFAIVFSQTSPTEGSAELPTAAVVAGSEETWKPVDQLWEALESSSPWGAEGDAMRRAAHRLPLWESLRQGLVRLERLRLAGDAYREQADRLQANLQQVADQLSKPDADAVRPQPCGLQLARNGGGLRDTPQGNLSLIRKLRTPADGAPPPNDVADDYLNYVAAAWQWAQGDRSEGDLGPYDPQFFRDKLAAQVDWRLKQESKIEPLEYRYLRMLARLPPRESSSTLSDAAVESVRNRELAERTAACRGDERIHYWVQHLVDRTDQKRRSAEDILFIGDDASAQKLFGTTDAEYRRAQQTIDALSRALGVRDRAWADLPHYLRWLTRRPHLSMGAADDERALLEKLTRAVEYNHLLSMRIEQAHYDHLQSTGEPLRPLDVDAITAAADEVDNARESLAEGLERIAYRWANLEQSQEVAWRESADLLAVPVVPARVRKLLRNQLLSRRFAEGELQSLAGESVDPAGAWLAQWKSAQHPLVALLDRRPLDLRSGYKPGEPGLAAGDERTLGDEARRSVVEKLDEQGRRTRHTLRGLLGEVRKWLDDSETAAANPADSTWYTTRESLSKADRTYRTAMALLPAAVLSSPTQTNPIARLREADLHHALTWYGRRFLDDFWGDDGRQGGPFFVAAAESCLDAATRCRPGATQDADQLRRRIVALRQVCDEGFLKPVPDTATAPTGDGQVARFAVAFRAGTPPGRAAFYVGDTAAAAELGPRTGIEVVSQTVTSPQFNESASFRVPPSGTAPGANLQLVGLWRGHYRTAPITVHQPAPGGTLTYRRTPDKPAAVLVRGSETPQALIVLVLDCSSSMKDDNRMAVARNAVSTVIDALVESSALTARDNYHFSLWLYGHRIGVLNATERAFNPVWEPFSHDLMPGDDVERVVKADLNRTTQRQFTDRLNKTSPFGWTPLYYAMQRAVEDDLVNWSHTAPRHLIVITDGENQIRSDGAPLLAPRINRADRIDDVVKVLSTDAAALRPGDRPIRVDVIGCGPDVRREWFTPLLNNPRLNSEYRPASDGAALIKSLREILHLYDYEVVQTADNSRVGEPVALNKTTEVEGLTRGDPRTFEARLLGRTDVKAKFRLEGGESIQLNLDVRGDGMRLVHRRYPERTSDWIQGKPLVVPAPKNAAADSSLPASYYVAALRPETFPQHVTFPITIQNGDEEQFSPRPAEVWVEITPQRNGRPVPNFRRYGIYDVDYRPDLPVPVLNCTVNQWPQGAREASIRLWWKPVAGAPSLKKTISALDGAAPLALALDDDVTATFRLLSTESDGEGVRVEIQEVRDRPQDPADVVPVRVEIVRNGLNRADETVRAYSLDGISALHTFQFKGVGVSDVRGYELRLTTPGDVKRGALSLPDDAPLRVWLQAE